MSTHFIEQVKYYDGEIRSLPPVPIHLLNWSLTVSNRSALYNTIAVFKVHRKPKPVVVKYDYDLKTMITE